VRTHDFHNTFVAWPEGRPADFNWKRDILHGGKCEVQVKAFHKTKEAAYAHMHATDYMEGPTTLDRRIFFLGHDGMWVRDTISAPKGFKGTIGPAFQFTGVYPKKGDHWADACQTSVPVAFISEPRYMIQFHNRPLDLLVWYGPRHEAELVIDDVITDKTGINRPDIKLNTNFRERVWYQMKMDGQRDRRETFDSILLLHRPTADGESLARGIELMLEDGADRVAVKIGRLTGQTLYVGINADGKPMTAGPVTTDAKCFLVVVGRAGHIDNWTVDANMLSVGGKAVVTSCTRDR
jgi:hypothetical protein